MNKTKHKLIAVTAAMLTMMQMGICASAANVITVDLPNEADTLGYTVKGYFKDSSGNYNEVTATKSGDKFLFTGVPGNADYQMFFYDVINYNNEVVNEKAMGYMGDLAYYTDNDVISAEANLSYTEIAAASSIELGEDKNTVITRLITGDPVLPSTTDNTSSNTTTTPANEVVDNTTISANALNMRVTSNVDIRQLYNSACTVAVSDWSNTITSFQQVTAIAEGFTDGDYVVAVGFDDTIFDLSACTADNIVTIVNGEGTFNVNLVPKCTLQVTDNNAPAAQFTVISSANVTTSHNSNSSTLGVRPGGVYTVINNATNKEYTIEIPTTAGMYGLDFATTDGTPINESAYSEAELNNTASEENPFNIPETQDTTHKDVKNYLVLIGVGLLGILSGIAKLIPSFKHRGD